VVQTFVFSLIYGPVAVTLGCWLCAIGAARARQETVVPILSPGRNRLHSRRPRKRLRRPAAPWAAQPARLVAREIVGHTPEHAAEAHESCQRRRLASQPSS